MNEIDTILMGEPHLASSYARPRLPLKVKVISTRTGAGRNVGCTAFSTVRCQDQSTEEIDMWVYPRILGSSKLTA